REFVVLARKYVLKQRIRCIPGSSVAPARATRTLRGRLGGIPPHPGCGATHPRTSVPVSRAQITPLISEMSEFSRTAIAGPKPKILPAVTYSLLLSLFFTGS